MPLNTGHPDIELKVKAVIKTLTKSFQKDICCTKCSISELNALHTSHHSLKLFHIPQDYSASKWDIEDLQCDQRGCSQLHMLRQESVWDSEHNWEADYYW